MARTLKTEVCVICWSRKKKQGLDNSRLFVNTEFCNCLSLNSQNTTACQFDEIYTGTINLLILKNLEQCQIELGLDIIVW